MSSRDPANADERWLLDTVHKLSTRAGIKMPEVAVYEGEPNAFATGAFKNSALVAVSTGLLQTMNHEEVEAVLAHEVAHVANGDMVTMTLIQGVVNTFVVFLSRIVGYVVDKQINKDGNGQGIGYFVTSLVCQVMFGVLASMIVAWFSRYREFRADAGAASYMGQPNSMISALSTLGARRARRASEIHPGIGDQRQAKCHGAILDPPSHRGPHHGTATASAVDRVTAGLEPREGAVAYRDPEREVAASIHEASSAIIRRRPFRPRTSF